MDFFRCFTSSFAESLSAAICIPIVTKVPPFGLTGSPPEFLWESGGVQCPKKRGIFLLWLPQLTRPNWPRKVREMDKETEYI